MKPRKWAARHVSFSCRLGLVAVLAAVAMPAMRRAAEAAPVSGVEFQRKLASPIGVTWAETPLRRALTSLGNDTDVAILLDRRIDPDKKITFAVTNAPLNQALKGLAAQLAVGVSYAGPVVYFGPPPVADNLATVIALRRGEAQRLPDVPRRKLLSPQAFQWDQLATPREIIERLAAEGGVHVTNPEQIPHDLWPAAELPPTSVVERMSIVLAGFDLTFDISNDGTAARIVPWPANVVMEHRYPGAGNAQQLATRLTGLFPSAKIRVEGAELVVAARWEDHQEIDRLLKGEPVSRTTVRPGPKVYTLEVQNQPVGALMKLLAERLEMRVQFDEKIIARLRTQVSFNVKNVPLDELLKAALGPVNLDYEIDGDTIKVVAAKKE